MTDEPQRLEDQAKMGATDVYVIPSWALALHFKNKPVKPKRDND